MNKTKFTKRLAFKTMTQLFIIVIIVSFIAATIIGINTRAEMAETLRDYTYEASLTGSKVASSRIITDNRGSVVKYLKTKKNGSRLRNPAGKP